MQFRKRGSVSKYFIGKKTGVWLLDFFRFRSNFKRRNRISEFIHQHHFMLGFLLLALVAGAMGGLYDGANKKLAERPGKVMAVGEKGISANFGTSYALRSDNTVWAWGYNQFGSLGDNTTVQKITPTQVKGPGGIGFLNNIIAISAAGGGGSHALGLKSDGTVWAWGYNPSGQIGDNTAVYKIVPVQVLGPGGVGFLTGITVIGGGDWHSLARKSDGTVWAWGRNDYGQLGDNSLAPPIPITYKATPGQVLGPGGVGFLTGIIAIDGGKEYSIALKSDGTVWTWGNNNYGQLGDNTYVKKATPVQVRGLGGVGFLTSITAIASGQAGHSIALKSDGTVWTWGNNANGQLGYGDGSVTSVPTPAQVKGPGGSGFLTGIIAISGGDNHSMALKSDGTVWTWGYNNNGQLGMNTIDLNGHYYPVQVVGPGGVGFLTNVTIISAGFGHNMALKADGTIWTWGYDVYGQLGKGSLTGPQRAPVQVVGPGGVGIFNVTSDATDTTPPTPGSPAININNGAGYTNNTTVSLKLEATDNIGVAAYYVAESPQTPPASGWVTTSTPVQTFSLTRTYTFQQPSAGPKTIYVWFKDAAGNISPLSPTTISDTITYDKTAPSGVSININNGAVATRLSAVTLTTLTASDNSYGVNGYYASELPTQPTLASAWVAIATTTSYSSPRSFNLSSNGTKSVYVWFKDVGGNISPQSPTTVSDSIIYDSVAPTPGVSPTPAISINSGAEYASSTSVLLSLAASDNLGVTGYYLSTSSTPPAVFTGTGWTLFASTSPISLNNVPYTLSSGSGTKRLYVWFKDITDALSVSSYDDIKLDTVLPVIDVFTIDNGATSTKTLDVTLNLRASDSYGVMTGYYASESSNPPLPTDPNWISISPSPNYEQDVTYYFNTAPGSKTVYVWFKDGAGNVSSPSSDTIYSRAVGLGENVKGWGWSEGMGWINFSAGNAIAKAAGSGPKYAVAIERSVQAAFNTLDQITKFFKLNFNHNLAVKTNQLGIVKYVSSFIDSMSLSIRIALAAGLDWGVSIDPMGQFSGYAWSDSVGWVYFGPDATLPSYGLTEASAAPNEPRYWAKWTMGNFANDSVTGWAKVLALGNDGWIKMSDSSVGTWAGKGVGILSNGDFTGWGWNSGAGGGAGLGWISFNARVCDLDGNGFVDVICGGDNSSKAVNPFVVYVDMTTLINPPKVINLTAPNWSYAEAAGPQGAKNAILSWEFSSTNPSETQSAYQVIINTVNSTSSPIIDTLKTIGSATQYRTTDLNWNTNYYWFVRVWDSKDTPSEWTKYDSLTDTDNDNCLFSPPATDCRYTFTTYKHLFPIAQFTWLPQNPSKDQDVNFIDLSQVVTSVGGAFETASTSVGTKWEWTFDNGDPATATIYNPVAKFTTIGSTTVTLKITDNDKYYTSTSTTFNKINFKLPSWIEQKP